MSPPPAARWLSRQAALQALYAADVGPGASLANAEAALDLLAQNFEVAPSALPFARELVAGVSARQRELDAQLEAAAQNWRLARMATVERNVLRIAAFELATGLPPEVALDEAIELARRFGDDGAPRFVNGVLGALVAKQSEARP